MKIKKDIENLMIEKITGLNKNQLFLNDYKLDEIEKKELEKFKKRFLDGEPIEYIVENAEFYGYDFFVDSRVLVPRNDTEIMVEQALRVPVPDLYIDIGTGSSCIILSILLSLRVPVPNKNYVIDISEKALQVSKINIEKYNLEDKIIQIYGDLLENFSPHLTSPEGEEHKNIIITANLPYIKNDDFENMDEETVKFEPDLALYGGEKTGFELYEKLIHQIMSTEGFNPLNNSNIILFIEIGFDQKEIAIKFLEKQNLQFEIFKDNGGVERCVKIYF